MAIYLSHAWKIENMKDSGFDPHDKRSGPKPRDGGHKPMHISFNAKNRKALAKIKDKGGISQYLNRILDPISETMDPGPASPILLEFWNGLADKMASLVKEGELDTATTIGHVLVDIKPIVQPYLDLCEEDDEEKDIATKEDDILNIDAISVNNYDDKHTLESITQDDVSEMINDVLVVKLSEQLYNLLQTTQRILQKIPSQYKTKWYSDSTDELSIKTKVTEKILKKYGTEILQQQENAKDDNLDVNSDSTHDFRKDLPIFDTLKQCKEITQKAKGIQNKSIRSFISESCEFVQDTANKVASLGIDINIESYRWDEESNSYFVDLFNCGNYDVDISEVCCDEQKCFMHAWYAKSSNSHLPADKANTIQFRPCRPANDTAIAEHKVTIKTQYKEFFFVIKGKKSGFN